LKSGEDNYFKLEILNSLDPRVSRLPHNDESLIKPKMPLDQFGTFEVFVEPKEGKPFQHEGIVHAPNLEMAYVFAKEAFTRRFTCTSLYVVDTKDVYVSPMTEGEINVYDLIPETSGPSSAKTTFEIFHLIKRGKQHLHAGSVIASNPLEAMVIAKTSLNTGKIVYNVWAIRTDKIRFTTPEEKDLWITLPEKKFRDAAAYKGGDKLRDYLERSI
jgi:ring-1,2-phenylacetyl-CoA epoxidase subunit PaaB